eukprot:TRINITY_DN153_c0_g1_i1.p1 TRINITY_DN153_c0_g1~~TRINITY_DN153_c0_g1_i1.p1  ORF type:complete len:665 (-),score=219.78 TRINITY_DN153_c0_g1_i1:97-1968(-)
MSMSRIASAARQAVQRASRSVANTTRGTPLFAHRTRHTVNTSAARFAAPYKAVTAHQFSTAATTSASSSDPAMFCFQCEQTDQGTGCTTVGVCGKDPITAALQDTLVHSLKSVGFYAHRLKNLDPEIACFVNDALFATLTNVNFAADRITELNTEALKLRDQLKAQYIAQCESTGTTPETPNNSLFNNWGADLSPAAQSEVGVLNRKSQQDANLFSLQELLTYGLKGMAAYAAHAHAVGKHSEEIAAFTYEALSYLTEAEPSMDQLLALSLKCGEINILAMKALNEGHIEKYGNPEPTPVRCTPVPGKCILVSGHDLTDLEEILKLTEGTGINVYTHGELLPAHGYPGLKKYSHLVGNYGGPWQLQKVEFAEFPGPIIVTTNCLVEPRKSYANRIYTTNAVGFDNITHLQKKDFGRVVDQAQQLEGFLAEELEDEKVINTMTGFGHNAVLGVADQVVDAVQAGAIKHFFLIGGCDGAEGERSYYKKLAMSAPQDTAILTLACGKYRFNKQFDKLGMIGDSGIPRMLDIGQCNDAYSAVLIANALADAFKTDINSLPLSFVLSWFEQKAVAVLLSLLHLGVKDIRIGPKLPAFITPDVLDVLVKEFRLTPIGEVESDLKAMLNK